MVAGFVRCVRELSPDLVVASGDFTMAGRHAEYRAAAAMLGSLSTPVLAVPGNHDLPVYNLVERFVSPLRRYRRHLGPVARDAFVGGPAALLGLNSARPWGLSFNWSHGRLSASQVRRADAFFEKHAGRPFKALVVHHPFQVPEDLPGFRTIGNGDAMLEVLARHGVRAVLAGHLHRQFQISRTLTLDSGARDVVLVQVSTLCSRRARDQANGFVVLDVQGSDAELTEHLWDGSRFAEGNRSPLGDAQS